jgi:hypothetical protein
MLGLKLILQVIVLGVFLLFLQIYPYQQYIRTSSNQSSQNLLQKRSYQAELLYGIGFV